MSNRQNSASMANSRGWVGIAAMFLSLLFAPVSIAQVSTDLVIEGNVTVTLSGRDPIRVQMNAIRNRNVSGNSGTVNVRAVLSTNRTYTTFNEVGSFSLASLPNQFFTGSGTIPGGSSFTDLDLRIPVSGLPASGLYYLHIVVTEFNPSLPSNGSTTHISRVTFDRRVQVSSTGLDFASSTPPPTDDHGNTLAASTLVTGWNRTLSGSIETAGDIDVFRIRHTGPGNITIQSTGTTDLTGELLDGAGRRLVFNDDGGTGLNFRITRSVTGSGTLYLRVRHFNSTSGTGSYSVQFNCTNCSAPPPSNDVGNTRGTARALTGTSGTFSSSLTAGDRDYFRFRPTVASTLTVFTTGSTDTFGTLQNSVGQTLRSNDDGGSGTNFRIVFDLRAQTTYYLEVRHFNSTTGTGNYTLQYSLQSSAPEDDIGNTPLSGRNIGTLSQAGFSGSFNLGNRNDVDFFRFELSSRQRMNLETRGSTNTQGVLYDSTRRAIWRNTNGGEGTNFRIRPNRFFSAGTYYIAVRSEAGSSGTYQLRASCFAGCGSEPPPPPPPPPGPDDAGNTPETAQRLTIGQTFNGTLTAGDADFFTFNLSGPSQINIVTTGSTNTFGTLYNSRRQVIWNNDNGGSGQNFRIAPARVFNAGTYYVRVRHADTTSGTGNYALTITAPGGAQK